MLKHIYAILPLNEKEINNKSYAVLVKASAWFKKNKEMNERKFYFAASDNEQLETWTIYMEFAKAKAVYDDFVNAFGKIKFPITSQEDQYDPTIKFEIDTKKKQQFDIQKINENKPKTSKSIMYRQSRMSNVINFILL